MSADLEVGACLRAPTSPPVTEPVRLAVAATVGGGPAVAGYELVQVDPRTLTYLAPERVDDVLRGSGPVIMSLDRHGILMPVVTDDHNMVYPGYGRTRVLWALDRGVETIPVMRIFAFGTSPEDILLALATEDLKQTTSYERPLVYLKHFLPHILAIHNDEKKRRQLEKNVRISEALRVNKERPGRDPNDPLAHHKAELDTRDSWDKRESQQTNKKRRHDKAVRFRLEKTIADYFGDVRGETFWRKVLELHVAETKQDIPLLNIGLRGRRERMGRGEYSPSGLCRLIRDTERAAKLKQVLENNAGYDEQSARLAVKWIFERIRRDNVWTWDKVNPAFGLFRQLKEFKACARRTFVGDPEDFDDYFNGAFPGADIPLNLMAYLTNPGDLFVDFFAGSGASGDCAARFLDPFWPTADGTYVFYRHWRDEFSHMLAGRDGQPNLHDLVFPADYFVKDGVAVDHSRKCLQFDLFPNPMALNHFGPEFILPHDVHEGITASVEDRVRALCPEGAQVIYLDPPYGTQNAYAAGTGDLSAASFPQLVEVLSNLIIDCRRILAPTGRIALLMGTDWRQANLIDPGAEIVRNVATWFESDDAGPLGPRIDAPTSGFGARRMRARTARLRRLANRQRYIHILVPKCNPGGAAVPSTPSATTT